MKLILASTSKFKNKILDQVSMHHDNIESDFDEINVKNNNVYEYVKTLSLGKAKSIENKVKEGIILRLDTIVYVDNQIIEKPHSLEEARNNLKLSSGKTSSVITGIAIINKYTNEIIPDYQETKITLNEICDEDINYYIENEPGAMYTSGFVIESVVSNFIKNINGSFYNILGVPVEKIYDYLLKWNIHLKDLES